MSKDALTRVCWAVSFTLLAAPLLARAVLLMTTPGTEMRNVADFIYDDGYYYLTIAANLADFGRSTFDGLTATNGYQPLWLWLLAALGKFVGTEPRTLFIASLTLIYIIACCTPLLAILWWKSESRYLALCIAAGLSVVIVQQPTVFIEGLEPILMAPIMVLLVMQIESGKFDPKTLLKTSVLLTAAFLTRLDALALSATTILCMASFQFVSAAPSDPARINGAFKTVARLCAVVVPTVMVYLLINQWQFGSAVPVSGIAKMIGAPKFSNWGVLLLFYNRWKSACLMLFILLPLEWLARRLQLSPRATFFRSLLIVSTALVIQSLYYASFSSWYVWPWYTYLIAVDIALVVARIIYLSGVLYTQERARIAVFAALALLGLWATDRSASLVVSSFPSQSLSKVPSLKWLGPGSAVREGFVSFNEFSFDMLKDFFGSKKHTLIAMGDRAGGLSFWGRGKLSVVQTEGLVLNIDYLRARGENAGAQYLETFPIEYFVVDREVLATVVGADGRTTFVVADPIQGRVTTAPVPTFCFPAQAIRYEKTYESTAGRNSRIAFAFSDRVPCGPEANSLIEGIERGIGLRQYSLPSEYYPAPGATFSRTVEDRDRRHAGLSSP